ncbi:helix-turn-helix domain-containing protein [Lawsonibacter sp. LCP25S3_G6]|uniref:helix-turn-helix domain-containing protein n=1 Tax=unclassified Lawsonibacter TaxID=2617946 RepID=UPI003F9D63CC
MIDYKLIGSRIKNRRISQKLSQDQLAEMADITPVYLSRIENGHAKPSLDVYERLCGFLDCDLAYLFCGVSVESNHYQCEKILELFQLCTPRVKLAALHILELLSQLK